MMRLRRSWSLVRTCTAAALVMVVVTACGSSESLGTDADDDPGTSQTTEPTGPTEPTETTRSSEPTEEPTHDGVRITGDGYSYAMPEGWEDIIDDPRSEGADTFVRATEAVDGFTPNINTVVTPAVGIDDLEAGSPELEQLREQFATSVETQTGVRPQPVDDLELDGSFAIGHTIAEFVQQGRPLALTQYLTVRDEVSYVVTVTGAASDGDAAAVAGQTVLDSWTWE